MNTTLITEIMDFVFGRKYYANVVKTNGLTDMQISSFIFANREAANRHRRELDTNLSYNFVETISFRSRKIPLGLAVKC